MAVRAAAVGRVDGIDIAVEYAGALVDVLGIRGIRGRKFGGDGKAACAQHAFESPRGGMARQNRQRIARDRLVLEPHGGGFFSAFSRATRSHDERPCTRWSTANCNSAIAATPPGMRSLPRNACTQTHFMSGSTSQLPLSRTPPQGPFRNAFGQFMGHDMPVELSTHWPHIRQSNSRPLTTFSTPATGLSIRS